MTARRRTSARGRARSTPPARPALDPESSLPVPAGMSARTVRLDDDEYLIVAMPLPSWELPEQLTEAEREVALAVLRGKTNDEVARDRRTSVRTVANQLSSIFAKLGVSSRIELAHRLRTKDRRT
jgi:DNA-binding NarL/FixJ family response regulator